MHTLVVIFLILVCLALLGISGYYTVKGAIDIKDAHQYSGDDDFEKAHKYLTTASIVIWISIAVLILSAILFIVFLGELSFTFVGKLFFWVFFIALLALLGVSGGYAALASQKIRASKNYANNSKATDAFKASLIASSASLGALLLVIGLFVSMFVLKARKHKSDTDEGDYDDEDE